MENKNTIDICKELHQNFIDFAYEANSQRAFPDARDGLKPGQRACLWEMFTKGYLSNKPHVKSAKISGGVIASWWPHGDTAIYETFARMSQNWINNIPEVDWHGANGNIVIGNAPASSRYTEAKLAKATEEGMFCGIKKNNVPMILNFSEDEEWPEVLPAIMPRLLINGSQGIGVTIANVWLPMNLIEISNSIKDYIKTGVINNNSVYPDFPSGGIIINKDDLHLINETGKGKVVLRAKTEIKNNSIFITELPYQVFVEPLLDEIKKLVSDGELEEIKEIYNKTDKKKLLIEIECKSNPEGVLKKLFNSTNLQKNYNANQFALVGKTPSLLNLKRYYDIYISHNTECISKEYIYDLKKAEARNEIVNGLLKALEDIDNIIKLIKASKSAIDAKENLINKYKFSEAQAKAIVDMKLGKIANLEKIELENEKKELEKTIENCKDILSNNDKILNILIERLESFTKKYGSKRKTELTQINISKEDKEIINVVPEDVVVMVTQSGEIKRIPKKSFRAQRRNGKGIKSINDIILTSISTNTIDNVLIFTNSGKMYKILVDNIPVGTNVSKGESIYNLINIPTEEKIIAATSINRDIDKKYAVFITKQGLFKKTLLEEYKNIKKATGIQAIKLKDNDSIAKVFFMNEENFMIFTKDGIAIKFDTKDIKPIGRVTSGVKAIKLNDNDYVISGFPITNEKANIAIIGINGYGKKCSLEDFNCQGKGGKGVKTNFTIAGAELIEEGNEILLIGSPNSICISEKELPLQGRSNLGVKIAKNNINNILIV